MIGPQILKVDLWKKSGHYDNYRENMYFTRVDEVDYGLKPMNCVAHIMVYRSQIRSYRDLPLRYFELGTVNRHEKSGVLHGLLRVREFTQDDAHIFCRPDQLHEEISAIISFVSDVMAIFGFEYELEISTRPAEKFIGRDRGLGQGGGHTEGRPRRPVDGLRHQRGRRRVLRAEDRREAEGRHRQEVAVRHHPARFRPS